MKFQRKQLSRSNKIARLVWRFVWLCLYLPSPTPFHAWRRMLLRMFGAKIGRGVHPYPRATIWAPWNLEMHDFSCIADNVDIYCVDKVCIGAHSTISQYSYLCTASHDYTSSDFDLVAAPIDIGSRVWIAADVFLGPGVIVGEGAVVAARSVVARDIPAWVVVAGNPAKIIKTRPA